MSKGLTLTLAAVATAWFGQAFAMAPVISDIPSPIVSDGTAATEANVFVYPDALNLDNYVNDPDGSDAAIKWSHWSADARYIFNGAQPLADNESPLNPPAAKVINSNQTLTSTGEENPDGNPATATVRDQKLSPLTGTPTETAPAADGIFASSVVTLFASDETAYTSETVIVYTENNGTDRLSGSGGERVLNVTFDAGPQGWVGSVTPGGGQGTAVAAVNQSICMTLSGPGNNLVEWISPYALFQVAKNSVYRVRVDMTTNQNVIGKVPFWDLIFQNIEVTNGVETHGDYAYAADYFFLDNLGGANAIKGPAPGRNVFFAWFAPAAVLTPQWQSETTGAYSPANDPNNDCRMVFRSIDVDNSGILSANDEGQICMGNLSVDKFDMSTRQETEVLSVDTFSAATVTKTDLLGSGNGSGSIIEFPNGGETMRIRPADANGWLTELTTILPGDQINPNIASAEYGNGQSTLDNWPIPWQSDKLMMIEASIKASDANFVNDGPDAIRLTFMSKTLEVWGDQFQMTGLGGAGRPTMQAAPYVFLFWTHNESASDRPLADYLRWGIDIFNTTSYNRPTVANDRNQGGVDFEYVKVKNVTFPGMGN